MEQTYVEIMKKVELMNEAEIEELLKQIEDRISQWVL